MSELLSIKNVFEKQRLYKYELRDISNTDRKNKLIGLKNIIHEKEQDILAALNIDLRKSTFEASLTELYFVYAEIDFAIKNLKTWTNKHAVSANLMAFTSRNYIIYEPKGVCLIIAPWNYPFQLLIAPLVSAIAAGNCCILKPSEYAPATSKVLKEIINSFFDPQEVYLFEGNADLVQELMTYPFDHLFFTGSTQVGKLLMKSASEHLTSVTLELGGKSPCIVLDDVDLEKAAKKIVWGKFINAGQTCIAPDYVLIAENLKTAFINELKAQIIDLYYSDGIINEDAYCKIINEKHFNRILSLINDAKLKGAILELPIKSNEYKLEIEPMILTGISKEMQVMKEEIFGPVLPILTFTDLKQAIDYVNAHVKPLALYIFGKDDKNIQEIIKNTSSGGVCINDTLVHISNPNLPFGGVNHSGMGSSHGFFGFKNFSHERAVMDQSRIDFNALAYPPYDKKKTLLSIIKKLM